MNQIRFEEVIETFRSTWWFQNRLVWNGSYSFLGWSGTLVFFYNIFGVSLFTPKYVKLFIELIAIFSLAGVLYRYFGYKRALVPLFLIGLSPTFLYFNSLSLSMGLEVSYFCILLFIVSRLKVNNSLAARSGHFAAGFLAMFAALSYFGFLFFLPLLAIFYTYRVNSSRHDKSYLLSNLLVGALGFLIPLLICFIYIQNRSLLIYDPLLGRGLFRSFGSIEFSSKVFTDSLMRIKNDLFILPSSYYFEQKKVEFSDLYPLISVIGIFLSSVVIFLREKKVRFYIGSLLALLLGYFLVICFIGPQTLGGIRRGTVLLVIFYGLLSIGWNYFLSVKHNRLLRISTVFSCLLLLLHHLLVYPANLRALNGKSQFSDRLISNTDNPQSEYLNIVSQAMETEVVFYCLESSDKDARCPGSSLIYSIVAGNCYWNKILCHKVIGVDANKGETFNLNLDFWGRSPHAEP